MPKKPAPKVTLGISLKTEERLKKAKQRALQINGTSGFSRYICDLIDKDLAAPRAKQTCTAAAFRKDEV
jgi:hypothetical protein